MIKEFFVYQLPKPAIGVFDHFLGGIFLTKGIPLFLQLAVLVLYPLAFGLLVTTQDTSSSNSYKTRIKLSQLCSLTAFSLSALLLFTPWDESFINLRHSFNLAQHHSFSFNVSKTSEGTVDFLVFAILGFLGKLKLPLLELLLFQSWLGGLLCILAIHKMGAALEIPKAPKWTIFICTLFPPLMLNSAHGFSTTLFAANILWALYFLFIRQNLGLSFFMLSLIPLVRWEGFWFVALCYAYIFRNVEWLKARYRTMIPWSLLALVPTLCLTLYRINQFGSWIPVPVVYKSSLGNLFYLTLGIRNFFLDLVSNFSLAFTVCWILYFFSVKKEQRRHPTLIYPLAILILFTIPYYLSGGDWFPPAWGRYFFPLNLFLFIATWKLLSSLESQKFRLFLASFLFSIFFCSVAPTSSLIRLYELMFSHGSAMLSLNLKKRTENPTYRPQYLSQLGIHLKKTTDPTDRIGTSELATLSYFSERDSVDFLGLTDLELARGPLRQTPSFIRKNPKSAELPLLIFKRLSPERLDSLKPEYLYLFDFMIEILMDQKNTEDWDERDFLKAMHRWENKFKGLVDPLYGGLSHILTLGYTPIIVNYDNDFCALYFVRGDKLKDHQRKLRELGFTEKLISQNSNRP